MKIKATKKPVTIEAVKWDGENSGEIIAFCGDSAFTAVESQMGQTETEELYIKTLEGNHHASVGDYIIKGVNGEFYPCKPDIFGKTYDIVGDDSGKILKVKAGVRYFEDGEVNGGNDITYEAQEQGVKPLMPCVEDGNWCLDIDAETGVILNWPKGTTAHVHYKVCDCCGIEYFVDGNKVCDNESGKCCGYVPEVLCPNGEGWGDYMIMDIDENGQIQNWKKKDLEKWVEEATAKRDDD